MLYSHTIIDAIRLIRSDPELIELFHYYSQPSQFYHVLRDLEPYSPLYTLIINGIVSLDLNHTTKE